MNFEQVRPMLARNEQSPPRGIKRDSVQYRLGFFLFLRRERGKIDPRANHARPRIDPCNPVRMPHVRVNLVSDQFQFIEIDDRFLPRVNLKRSNYLKSFRIEITQPVCPVAQDQIRPVVRQPPPFAVVLKFPQLAERPQIVNKPRLRQPRQLEYLSSKESQSFAKIFRIEVRLLQHPSRLQLHFAQRRLSRLSRTLVKKPIEVFQPLRKSARIVRIFLQDLDSKHGNRLFSNL